MKPEWDGPLLIAVFALLILGAWAHVVPADKAGVWGDMILGALLLWVRSGNKAGPDGPPKGDKDDV